MADNATYRDSANAAGGLMEGIEQGVLLKVGSEIYPVYGNDRLGWSIEGGGLHAMAASAFRYESLEELFFVLVNFSVAPDGCA